MAVKISLSQQDIRKLLYVLFYDILRCFVHCVLGIDSLPYVEATILELLRYKTSAPMALPHRTMKDTELDGYFIYMYLQYACLSAWYITVATLPDAVL